MKDLTVAVLGDDAKELCKKIGKKSTVTDIQYYDHEEKDYLFTIVTPRDYPEKIQGVVNSLALADHVILVISQISKQMAELIISAEASGHEIGTIILNGITKEEIQPYLQGTLPHKYEILENDPEKIIQRLKDVDLPKHDPKEPCVTMIDQYFPVKGIGTVILGKVAHGTLRTHVKMKLMPIDKETTVRSIQTHDRDVKEAPTFSRVGVSLKGIEVEDLAKGDIITENKTLQKTKLVNLKFKKNPFYKKQIQQGERLHLALGLQLNPVHIIEITDDKMVLESEKDFVLLERKALLIDLNNPDLRIAGWGTTSART